MADQISEVSTKRGYDIRDFALVVGGGATCRAYQQAAARVSPLTDRDLDWIGIHATRFNAQLVKYLFKGFVNDDIIINPTKPVRMTKPIVIGAGYEPGHSTDMDAVLLAKKYRGSAARLPV